MSNTTQNKWEIRKSESRGLWTGWGVYLQGLLVAVRRTHREALNLAVAEVDNEARKRAASLLAQRQTIAEQDARNAQLIISRQVADSQRTQALAQQDRFAHNAAEAVSRKAEETGLTPEQQAWKDFASRLHEVVSLI